MVYNYICVSSYYCRRYFDISKLHSPTLNKIAGSFINQKQKEQITREIQEFIEKEAKFAQLLNDIDISTCNEFIKEIQKRKANEVYLTRMKYSSAIVNLNFINFKTG